MPMCYTCVDQSTVQIIERCGRFHRVVSMLFCWEALTARLACVLRLECMFPLITCTGMQAHPGFHCLVCLLGERAWRLRCKVVRGDIHPPYDAPTSVCLYRGECLWQPFAACAAA